MSNYLDLVNKEMDKYLVSNCPPQLMEAMRYSVFAGGKRLRPQLLLYAYEGFAADISTVMPFACAMEMIHTYSLIHDDLPAMDNDDFRRGKPTNHKVYGDAIAILAGDALLNLAYEIMAKACVQGCKQSMVSAMAEIAASAGISGMVGGQAADILSEDKTVDDSTLLYIQKNKTAAIIEASLSAGTILGLANDFEVEQMRLCGEYLGIAFQIKDDILDIESTTEALGKPLGSDAKNKKATYVSLYGMEAAKRDYAQLSGKASEILEGMNLRTNGLIEYVNNLLNRKN